MKMEMTEKFFNAIGVALVQINHKEHKFTYVNEHFVNMLGYDKEIILSKPITEFIYNLDMETTWAFINRRVLGNTEHRYINQFITASGEVITLKWFTDNINFDDTDERCTAFCLNISEMVNELQIEIDKKEAYIKLLNIIK